MFIPLRLLNLELKRSDCLRAFLQYKKLVCKAETCNLRIIFLDNCLKAEIIPNFLRFRIPNNGCFDERSVRDFQRRLLRKEWISAKNDFTKCTEDLNVKRKHVLEMHSMNPPLLCWGGLRILENG